MNVLTILNTCQHPLDPNPLYAPKEVHLSIRRVPPAASDDPCRLSRAENGRGFILTNATSYKETAHELNATRPKQTRSVRGDLPGRDPGGRTLAARDRQRTVSSASSICAEIRQWTRCSITRTIIRTANSSQDTIRNQRNIYLTAGTQLVSTRGTVLLTIVADTCGRHDTLGGACANESNMVRYAIEKRPHARLPAVAF